MTELADCFRAEAEWRRRKAEEYEEDERNKRSAEALKSLADYVDAESARTDADRDLLRTLAALQPHVFPMTVGGVGAKRRISRYGFNFDPALPNHREFLAELAPTCMEDAFELAQEMGGEDPTGALLPCELRAAMQGANLPFDYFERRSGRTEEELEAELELIE